MSETSKKRYEDLKIKTKDSEAHIEGELSWEELQRYRGDIIEELRAEFEAPGFRKGKAPLEVFLKHVRQDHLLEDAAERALQEAYPVIVEDEGLDTLGHPEVSITKLAEGNPLGFRMRIGLVPEIKLPDYLKIATEIFSEGGAVEVSPEETQKVVDELRQLRGGGKDGAPLPELTDEFVKTLGDFSDVADFRAKLAENMRMEKEHERRGTRREKLAEALGAKAKMTLPERVIDAEADAMRERLEDDLKRAKISFEDYLARAKKTEDELRADQRGHAERQLRTRFILEAIAKKENVAADPQEVAAEVHYLSLQHPDADRTNLTRYVENMLRNEAVLKFLEEGKKN